MIRYRHVQFGWITVSGCLLVGVTLLLIAILKKNDVDGIFGVPLATSFFIFSAIPVFYNLKTTVTDKYVHVVFGVGLIQKIIPLEEIESCTVKNNQFVLGWGLRYSWDFTLWNVSGLNAIELTLKNQRRRFRIGTDKPEELCDAILAALTAR